MNITFIGIGHVGSALAMHLSRAGHTVTIAARHPDSESVRAAITKCPALTALAPAVAVASADIIFLATPYGANAEALRGLEASLSRKVLVDCTNPVGPGLSHSLESKTSGAEKVQELAPQAHVVKAFTIYGYENFNDSSYPGYGELKPAMLIAGDDPVAKHTVSQLCSELGWSAVDAGPLANSLHLEHLTLLWIKMARVQGDGPHFVWARLQR